MSRKVEISSNNAQMLAEALTSVFQKCEALGIDFGGEMKTVESVLKTAKTKPETKTEKVERYKALLSVGGRMNKAEILNKIS